MVALCPLSTQPVVDGSRFVVGAQLSFYDAGTNTPRDVWKDDAQTATWAQPILTNARGCWPVIFTAGNPLKAVMLLPGGVAYETVDGLTADIATTSGGGGGGGAAALPSGFIAPYYGTGTISGWVRCNARTIGNAASGATERANADTSDLFGVLWNSTSLAVSGGRGVSAAADYAANKTITLPDLRGRNPAGLDDMGNSAAGRLAGITFAFGNSTTLGGAGGHATTTLLTANMPAHQHTGATAVGGNHQHTGTTYADGYHSHTGVTDAQGSHVHGGSTTSAGDHAHSSAGPSNKFANASGTVFNYWAGDGGLNQTTNTTGAHTHDFITSAGGVHTHNLVIDGGGSHTHAFLTDAGGSHAHTFTTDLSGSGSAFDSMNPFVLVTYFIKL